MNTTGKTEILKNLQEKSIQVSRVFQAPVETVWRAYTESKILDQWWGPSPWHVETKTMDFREGGFWLYAMVGPNGDKHWARMNYQRIALHKTIEIEDGFCDENGAFNTAMPLAKGTNQFSSVAGGTRVEFKLFYPSEADIEKIVEMGFEVGITMCMDQLEAMLESGKV